MIEKETREAFSQRWTWFLDTYAWTWLRSTGAKRLSLRSLADALTAAGLRENYGTLASWGREGKMPDRPRLQGIAQVVGAPQPDRMGAWILNGLGEAPLPATLDDAQDPRQVVTAGVRVGHRRVMRRPFGENLAEAHSQLAELVSAGGKIDIRILKAFTALTDAVEDLPRVNVSAQGGGASISSTPTFTWNDRIALAASGNRILTFLRRA